MNLSLPADADANTAIQWLKQLVDDFGPGFHLDSPPASYQTESGGACFTAAKCQLLESSLDNVFEILGEEMPYTVCADKLSDMLAVSAGLRPPLEFNDPDYQRQLLMRRDREELSAWLRWNGQEVSSQMSAIQLRDFVREQIALRDPAQAR